MAVPFCVEHMGWGEGRVSETKERSEKYVQKIRKKLKKKKENKKEKKKDSFAV